MSSDDYNQFEVRSAFAPHLSNDDTTIPKLLERARQRAANPTEDPVTRSAARWELEMIEAFDRWIDNEKAAGGTPVQSLKAMCIGIAQMIVAFTTSHARPGHVPEGVRATGGRIARHCDLLASHIEETRKAGGSC